MGNTILIISALLLVSACSSKGIESSDIESIRYGDKVEDVENITTGKETYRLDYMVDDVEYRFESHYLKDKGTYHLFLFEQGKLSAASSTSVHEAVLPAIRDCALFPPDFTLDVNKCFNDFNTTLVSSSISLDSSNFGVIDQEELDRNRHERAATTAAIAALFPIIVLPAVIALPLMAIEEYGAKSTREKFAIRLGDSYAELEAYVLSLPEKTRAIRDNSGSVLISGGFMDVPAVAFGFYDARIVWIDMNPRVVCSGGVFVFGMQCEIQR